MPQKSETRPNIILIMADQMRWDCIQAVNPHIKTPNIQRLVDNGLLVHQAYAPTPVCLPCRAAILTGQYPSTNGAMHNESDHPQDYYSSIGKLFRKEGYRTHMIGKSHLSSCHEIKSFESHPHINNREYFRRWKGPWYGFEHADISIGHTTEHHACGMHYGVWLEDNGIDTDKYFGHTQYAQEGAWDLPEEFHSDKWIAETTIDSISKAKQDEQPFFLWVNFQDPHNPYMVPEPWASMYNPNEIPQYGFKEGEPKCFSDKPHFYQELMESKGGYGCHPKDPGMPGTGNVSHLDIPQDQIQKIAAKYYGMVSLMDKYIGKIIDKVEESGELDNTIIVFTADHGDLLGDHGLWWKSIVPYDGSMRVPMVISYPNVIPKGQKTTAFHSSIDLSATFLSLANAEIPYYFEGVDQTEVWKDPSKKIRKDVIVEERPYNTDFNVRILTNEEYRMSFYANRTFGELYHIKEDPNQINNLWDKPEFSDIKNAMIARILSHEMNKQNPTANATSNCLSKFPKRLREHSDFDNISGKLRIEEGDQIFIDIPTSTVTAPLIGVGMEEILEDLYDIPINFEVKGKPHTGILNEEESGAIILTNETGELLQLSKILLELKGKEIDLMVLRGEGKKLSPKFRIAVEELFPPN